MPSPTPEQKLCCKESVKKDLNNNKLFTTNSGFRKVLSDSNEDPITKIKYSDATHTSDLITYGCNYKKSHGSGGGPVILWNTQKSEASGLTTLARELSTTELKQQWIPVETDTCLSKKLTKTKKDTKRAINEMKEENDNTMWTGVGIGALFTIVVCSIVFIFAKFKLIPLIYDRFEELLVTNQPLLIGVIVSLILVISISVYIIAVVRGGEGKQTIIGGSLELSNVSKTSRSSNENKFGMQQYVSNITNTENESSYIFWLKINEFNKNDINSPKKDELQHIFHIGTEHINYPGVYFKQNENKLVFIFSKNYIDYETIKDTGYIFEIDNIEFEKWFHVGIVIHKDYMEIYINAKLLVSKLFNKPSPPHNIPNAEYMKTNIQVYIGQDGISSNPQHTISGTINNLFNYPSALTHKEIESHYLSFTTTSQGYIRYVYKFIKKIVTYPKKLLFNDDDQDECKH